MATNFVLNDSAPTPAPTNGCCAGNADTTASGGPVQIAMQVNGSAGSGSSTLNLINESAQTCIYYVGTPGDLNGVTIGAGAWSIPLHITSITGGSPTFASISVCRASSSGGSLATIGQLHSSVALSVGTAIYSVTGVQTTFSAGDVVIISIQLSASAAGTVVIVHDQTVTAPASMAGGPFYGGVPTPREFGWYKRRKPIVGPVPMPANPGGQPPVPIWARLVNPLASPIYRSRRAVIIMGRPPLPGPIGPRPVPALVVRRDYRRGAVVYHIPLLAPPLAGRVPSPIVFRGQYRPQARVIRVTPFLKAPPANVAGGVPPPLVVRRDYRRGALVYRLVPPLQAPPVGTGSVPAHAIWRWDFERAAIVRRTRLIWKLIPLPPPPVLIDTNIWYACPRGIQWFACPRGLVWSADVITYLLKRSGETRNYSMEFSALPELQSGVVASVASITATALTVGAAALTLTNPVVGSDGKSATVTIAGGTPGARYKITYTVNVAGGIVLEDFGYLLVEDE